jgi:hypothetical protein
VSATGTRALQGRVVQAPSGGGLVGAARTRASLVAGQGDALPESTRRGGGWGGGRRYGIPWGFLSVEEEPGLGRWYGHLHQFVAAVAALERRRH